MVHEEHFFPKMKKGTFFTPPPVGRDLKFIYPCTLLPKNLSSSRPGANLIHLDFMLRPWPFLVPCQGTIEDIRTAKKLRKESCGRKVASGKLLAENCCRMLRRKVASGKLLAENCEGKLLIESCEGTL